MIQQKSGSIYLKIANLSDFSNSSFIKEAEDILSDIEKLRMSKYIKHEDRNLFLLSRYVLRTSLTKFFPDIEPKSWRFTSNKYGRLYVFNPEIRSDLYFSLSHSLGCVVCAFSEFEEIGVDVENTSRRINYFALAEDCFSKSEIEYLDGSMNESVASRFYKIWTLKESYIKARGMGFQIKLDDFSFEINEFSGISINFLQSQKKEGDNWKFKLICVDRDYQVAIAANTKLPIFFDIEFYFDRNNNNVLFDKN